MYSACVGAGFFVLWSDTGYRRGCTLDCNMLSLSEELKEGAPGSPWKGVTAHRGWPMVSGSTGSQDMESSFRQASLSSLITISHPSAEEDRSPSSVFNLSGFLVIVGSHEPEGMEGDKLVKGTQTQAGLNSWRQSRGDFCQILEQAQEWTIRTTKGMPKSQLASRRQVVCRDSLAT